MTRTTSTKRGSVVQMDHEVCRVAIIIVVRVQEIPSDEVGYVRGNRQRKFGGLPPAPLFFGTLSSFVFVDQDHERGYDFPPRLAHHSSPFPHVFSSSVGATLLSSSRGSLLGSAAASPSSSEETISASQLMSGAESPMRFDPVSRGGALREGVTRLGLVPEEAVVRTCRESRGGGASRSPMHRYHPVRVRLSSGSVAEDRSPMLSGRAVGVGDGGGGWLQWMGGGWTFAREAIVRF